MKNFLRTSLQLNKSFQNIISSYGLIFFNLTTSEPLLKFSLYDFNDYDDELAHLQIPTHDSLEQSVIELIIICSCSKTLLTTLFTADRLVIEVTWTSTATYAFRAIQNNYIYLTHLFKSNTMQHFCLIYNS